MDLATAVQICLTASPLLDVYFEQTLYRVARKNGTVDFLGLCSDQQLSSFTLLNRASFLPYNIKIIKLG